jgi:hypothetical protein
MLFVADVVFGMVSTTAFLRRARPHGDVTNPNKAVIQDGLTRLCRPRSATGIANDHPSPLPLLVPRVSADHEYDAAASNDLALLTHATDAGANLHGRTRDDGRVA